MNIHKENKIGRYFPQVKLQIGNEAQSIFYTLVSFHYAHLKNARRFLNIYLNCHGKDYPLTFHTSLGVTSNLPLEWKLIHVVKRQVFTNKLNFISMLSKHMKIYLTYQNRLLGLLGPLPFLHQNIELLNAKFLQAYFRASVTQKFGYK